MKYNIFINQRAAVETGLHEKLDLTDLALFDFVYDLMNNNRVPKTLIDGVEYTQIRHSLVSAQCPLLGINHRDPLRKRMLKLVDAGLLIRYERNQEENQSLYARGPRFSSLSFSDDLPSNNDTLPLENATPCRQTTPPPAVDERHNNTISINNNIKENNINPLPIINYGNPPKGETTVEVEEVDVINSCSGGSTLEEKQRNRVIREQKFRAEVDAYRVSRGGMFMDNIIDEFLSYWTEPNASGTKFRKELQTTWDTSRRLGTWVNRAKDYNHGSNQTKQHNGFNSNPYATVYDCRKLL